MPRINAIGKRRLTKLIEFMESLPRSANKHFDMGSWFTHNGEHPLPLPQGAPINAEVLKDCGTTACALGWAATMPYFNRLGLHVEHDGGLGQVVYKGRHGDVSVEGCSTPLFGGLDSFQWMELFSGSNGDRTPKQWARRARKLLKQWSA
jgi:hypothetical protein